MFHDPQEHDNPAGDRPLLLGDPPALSWPNHQVLALENLKSLTLGMTE